MNRKLYNLIKDRNVVGKELGLKDMGLKIFVEFPWEESIRLFKSKGLNATEAEQQAKRVLERIRLQSTLRIQSKVRQLIDLYFSVIIGIISETVFGWHWLFIITAVYSIIRATWLIILSSFYISIKNILMQLFLTFIITGTLAALTKFMTYLATVNTFIMILIVFIYGIGVIGWATVKVLRA